MLPSSGGRDRGDGTGPVWGTGWTDEETGVGDLLWQFIQAGLLTSLSLSDLGGHVLAVLACRPRPGIPAFQVIPGGFY